MTRALLSVALVAAIATPSRAQMDGEPSSPEQAKAWAALQKEFDEVAKVRGEKELRARAKEIITAIKTWKIDALIDECVMYNATAKDRRELTRKHFEEHKAAWQKAVKDIDVEAEDFAADLQWESPEPAAGMTGQVTIPFGPKVEPKGGGKAKRRSPMSREDYPDHHQLELWWSGPLMPEANGPVHAKPPAGAKPGRWRFYDVVLPYSRKPMMRL